MDAATKAVSIGELHFRPVYICDTTGTVWNARFEVSTFRDGWTIIYYEDDGDETSWMPEGPVPIFDTHTEAMHYANEWRNEYLKRLEAPDDPMNDYSTEYFDYETAEEAWEAVYGTQVQE